MIRIKYLTIVLHFFIIYSCSKNDPPATQGLPTITSISPTSGGVNTIVTINGSNFSSNAFGNVVTINGKPATIVNGSNNTITVSVPPGAGSGPIIVTVNNNTATGPIFTYNYTYTVSTIAGNGLPGFLNGVGTNARFTYPQGIAIDGQNNIYVADGGNNCIRKITPAGVVTTFAGNNIRGFADGRSDTAEFSGPIDVAVDAQGNVYATDISNFRIRKVSGGFVTTLAGSGLSGFADGPANTAKFSFTEGIAVDVQGNVYVADKDNQRIRKISGGMVTTLAGTGTQAFLNGPGNTANFYWPRDVTLDVQGNIYVADSRNQRFRKINSQGIVSTFAGDGSNGYRDGNASTAWFAHPVGAVSDAEGNVYVTDESNQVIRKISSSGIVSTIAGNFDVIGFTDGPASIAKFNYPNGLALDQQGNIYVADRSNHCIRKITRQ